MINIKKTFATRESGLIIYSMDMAHFIINLVLKLTNYLITQILKRYKITNGLSTKDNLRFLILTFNIRLPIIY